MLPSRPLPTWLLLTLSAILLILAFPHANLWFLAWVGIVPLFYALRQTPRPFRCGWLFGFIFFTGTLWWIGYVTVIGMLCLTAYLAIYWALFAGFYRYSLQLPLILRILSVPAVYVCLEYVRERALTGFGWASLGHSQAAVTPLIQIAEFTGVAGVSFLIILINVIIAEYFFIRSRNLTIASVTAAFLVVVSLGFGYSRLSQNLETQPVNVGLIQGNITLEESWDPGRKTGIVDRLLSLSGQALQSQPSLLVWPETSFPPFIWEEEALLQKVRDFVKDRQTPLIFGAVTRSNGKYFNSALMIDPQGELQLDRYSKTHRVVFGEYIPFREQLRFLESIVPIDDFSAGEGAVLFDLNGIKLGSLICFEDTLPWLARDIVQKGGSIFVNITNDAWFRKSPGPVMHLHNAVFRTVENRRPLIRATNTGLTCQVDSFGHFNCLKSPQGGFALEEQGVLAAEVEPRTDVTFFTKTGDFFPFLCFLGILGVLVFPLIKKKNSPEVKAMSNIKKLLIIDDEKMLHSMLRSVLSSHGFEIISAFTGEDGIQMAIHEKPDLIILDVIMPGIKGREVCRRLKADPLTQNIPVLFLTAKDSEDDVKAEIDAGAIGHITKPLNSMSLVAEVKKFLGINQ